MICPKDALCIATNKVAKILVSFGDSWPWGSELDSLLSPSTLDKLDPDSRKKIEDIINCSPLLSDSDHQLLAEKTRQTYAYPYLTAQALGCDRVLDLSHIGTSLNHLFLALCEFNKTLIQHPEDQYIFLVSLTTMFRDMYFDQATGDPREIMPYSDTAWYYRHLDVERTNALNWSRIISLIQLFCKQHNIPDFYFQEFTNIKNYQIYLSNYQEMIDWSRIYCSGQVSFVDRFHTLEQSEPDISPNQFYSDSVKKYFYPCVNHPNLVGHQTISEIVVDFIKTLNPELVPA